MMLQRLFFGRADASQNAVETVPEIEDDQARNKYNEVVILNGHTNLVHIVIKLNDEWIFTASHDLKGIIWNLQTGKAVCELHGHSRIITSAILLEATPLKTDTSCQMVATASTDHTIRLWDLETGICQRVINDHGGTIKSFSVISGYEPSHFLTVGQDLCLWSASFQLLYKLQRNSLDYIHTVIRLKGDRIVTATDQPKLIVYNVLLDVDFEQKQESLYGIKEFKVLPPHRESITGLVSVSDAAFASSSMDGAIIIWTSHRLDAARRFNQHEKFMNPSNHTYPYAVHHMIVVEQRYIFAAIGTGFAVFDSMKESCVCQITHAHHSQVTCIALLDEGGYLATSSLDGTIRLWAATVSKGGSLRDEPTKSPTADLFGRSVRDLRGPPIKLNLVGACYGHTNSVQAIVECGNEGFVSIGNDELVILWKDSTLTQRRRDEEIWSIINKLEWFQH